jgi:hypothetical protein
MITIISQPTTGRLMAAYRPVISIVDFSTNVVPVNFNVTVKPNGEAEFLVQDTAPFLNPGVTTVTFGNAPGLNGTYNIFVLGISGPILIVQIGVTGGLPPGNYPAATIALNGVVIENATLSGVPKVVFCDVYINNQYYKSISKTHQISKTATAARFEFDIQDALQEYIIKYLYSNGGSAIETVLLNSVYCKFRSSTIDANGFIIQDAPIPIQGTGNSLPVSGGGTQGNSFWAVNATLQHEDNQDLQTHLNTFKTGNWNANLYPLTHRPAKYKICKNDNDFFPVVNIGQTINCLKIFYRLKNTNTFQMLSTCGAAGSCNASFVKIGAYENGLGQYKIQFQSAAAPYTDVLIEFSLDLGVTWQNVITYSPDVPSGQGFYNYDIGQANTAHYVRISPVCSPGSVGTTSPDFYMSTDYSYTWTAGSVTQTSFVMATGFATGVTWDLSIDDGATYIQTGLTSQNYTVTGLTANTLYAVVRRMHSINGIIQILNGNAIQTLP